MPKDISELLDEISRKNKEYGRSLKLVTGCFTGAHNPI